MPHATHKARRIDTSAPAVPVKRRRSRFEQQALLVVSVGFTMTIVIALYAATFKSRNATTVVDQPRWTIFDGDLLERARPVAVDLADVRKTLVDLVGAGTTQAHAAAILKAKIESRASASGTPETSPSPETPETP